MSSQPNSDESDNLAAQILNLEHQLAFHQRAFEELNTVVLEQQCELESMRRELSSLKQVIQGLAEKGTGQDLPHQKPPHY